MFYNFFHFLIFKELLVLACAVERVRILHSDNNESSSFSKKVHNIIAE